MRIGIDLGGTKIEILCLNEAGDEIYRKRIASPQGDYQKTISSIRNLVINAEKATGRVGTVGIAIPGTISKHSNLVKNANSTWLIGQPLSQDLQSILKRDVRIANDANCFALSESTDGAGENFETVFGVILGTGVGGGLIVNGHPLQGINSIAGEWGHNPLPWAGEDERFSSNCYCGLNGCIETYLSGPGLARIFENLYGTSISAIDIATQPDEIKNTVFALYENRLARALASIINVFDPDIIVLGGGVSNIERWYETVPNLWNQWVFSDQCDTLLAKAKYGDSSGVRGAAWLWPL